MPKVKVVELDGPVVENYNPTPYLDKQGKLTKLAKLQLNNPFAIDDISWKPTNVKNNKCVALAYADKRVYEERLDSVFGEHNWGVSVEAFTGPYHKVTKAKYVKYNDPSSGIKSPAEDLDAHKIFVIVSLDVNGFKTKASTSNQETDDENAIMTAEAQAFKRACSMFGIGKYFYNLDVLECDVDYGKIVNPPKLPAWAYPYNFCEDCSTVIISTSLGDKVFNPSQILKMSQSNFSKDLCLGCMKTRKDASKESAIIKETILE